MDRTQQIKGKNGRARPKKLYDNLDDEKLDLKIDSIKEKVDTPCFVYVLTFFSSLGGFMFGYDTSVISGAMLLLRNEFGLSSIWQELIVSVTLAAAAVFSLVAGVLNTRLGRRGVILIGCVIFICAAIMMAISIDKYMLLSGRLLAGAAIGMMSTTVPMYLAECSPVNIRGRLVSLNIAMVACGQFVASVVAGFFGGNQKNGWRYMLGLAGVPAFLQFLGFFFMPESPRWLIMSRQEEKARRVLQSMRGQLDIEDEYESIKMACVEVERDEQISKKIPVVLQMCKFPSLRRALVIGCFLQMTQQLAGINTVMYYSATIVKMSGVRSDEAAIWLSALTAAVNFVFTLLGLYLVEKIGRRPLTLASLIGAIVSLLLLAVGFHVASLNTPQIPAPERLSSNYTCSSHRTCNDCMMDLSCGYCFVDNEDTAISNSSCLPTGTDNPWVSGMGQCSQQTLPVKLTWAYDYCPSPFSWMPMVGLVLYLVTFAPGMGPMPWTINSEIYPLWCRSSAISVATFTNWIFNLLVSITFITLTENLTRLGTFLLYAGLTVLGALVLYIWLPETKGKSLEEVEGLFAQPWCGTVNGADYNTKTIQYVHIRGLNRDGRESELDSPE
ncbi:proton myo-inositol cotransporter-like [Mya arenaria]|uniref:proton myo-inositol cotransporter-like n=1 Tax=Mya arenaria TaxID=6604 RepID=UPI0022E4E047|nr:proton myo-inositol cotransporter-like [Mya arenaria]